MRQLIKNIYSQLIALLFFLSAVTFWTGHINIYSVIIYVVAGLLFLFLISNFWSLTYIVAFALATVIILPFAHRLPIVPGARALIAATIYGALFLLATLIITNQRINKDNGKDYDNSDKQS